MVTKEKRRNFTAAFKSQVALEALQGNVSETELGKRYDLHPNLISQWKQSLVAHSHRIFEDPHPEKDDRDKLIASQKKQISSLTEDVNFLKKNLKPYL
jgi:transposase-like protein